MDRRIIFHFKGTFKRKYIYIGLLTLGCFALFSMKIPGAEMQDPWVAPDEYQKMENPYKDHRDAENLGKRLFVKNCQPCHGSTGKGDGKNTVLMGIDMVDITDGRVKNQTDGSIFYKINNGSGFMPGFKVKLSEDKEKWLIVNYLRTLVK
jgi:mono/diheme cytochrome c family protein